MNLPFPQFFADPEAAEVHFRHWCAENRPGNTDFPALFDEWLDEGWKPQTSFRAEHRRHYRHERRAGMTAAGVVLVSALVLAAVLFA